MIGWISEQCLSTGSVLYYACVAATLTRCHPLSRHVNDQSESHPLQSQLEQTSILLFVISTSLALSFIVDGLLIS